MSGRHHALTTWLQQRAGHWQRLAILLRQVNSHARVEAGVLRDLVDGFRALGRDLALARATLPAAAITQQLESLYTQVHAVIYRPPHALWRELLQLVRVQVPARVHELRGALQAVVGLFVLSALIGWTLVWQFPELAGLFASEQMINQVQQGNLWTDGLINVVPSAWLSLSIMSNNIAVSLFAFTLGALYGLGTVYIIALNGLMLGGVFALTAHYGLAGRLFTFIVAHGVVELSIICLSGAAGLALGEALIHPGARRRAVAFQSAVGRAAQLLPVCAVFLMGAGLIEGYISPDDNYPRAVHMFIGLGYGVFFWSVLTGRVWRFTLRTPE